MLNGYTSLWNIQIGNKKNLKIYISETTLPLEMVYKFGFGKMAKELPAFDLNDIGKQKT